MHPDTDDKQLQRRRTFAAAARYAGIVVGIALVWLIVCLAWLSGCKSGAGLGSLNGCSGFQRNALAVGPPVILFLGGVGAFVRTIQVWRAHGSHVIWQGAGWFLLTLMLVVLAMTAPAALLSTP